MSDYFLKELWQKKAQEERGETKKWKYEINDFEEIIEKANISKEAKEELYLVLNWLKKSCKNYVNINEKWIMARKSLEEEKEERKGALMSMEKADQARRICHQNIVDNLNILSRAFEKYGLDNQWRNYFGNWDQIGAWAYEMGRALEQKQPSEVKNDS